jgi:hypothetical protein
MEVYIRPFIGSPPETGTFHTDRQWPISTAGGIYPQWRHDGKELFYINPEGMIMAVPIVLSATEVRPGSPVPLFPTSIYGGGVDVSVGIQYDVSAENRFLINTVLNDTAAPITLLQNWKRPQ